MTPDFDEAYWDSRYSEQGSWWSGNPNPQLVAEAAELAPGSALDVGSGEGADAIWLARRGWTVTAVDISRVALERSAAKAADDAGSAARIAWTHQDLTTWVPPERAFDLVSAQFMQLPKDQREALFSRLAAAVAPGGTLLIVGHHPSDMESGVHRPPRTDLFYTAEEVAESLDPDRWETVAVDTRARSTTDGSGAEAIVHDAVLRARRLL